MRATAVRGSGLSNLIKGGLLLAVGIGGVVFLMIYGTGGRHAIGLPLMVLTAVVLGAIMLAVGYSKRFKE